MPTLRLNKRAVEAISFTGGEQVFHRDDLLRGFALKATKTKKTYI